MSSFWKNCFDNDADEGMPDALVQLISLTEKHFPESKSHFSAVFPDVVEEAIQQGSDFNDSHAINYVLKRIKIDRVVLGDLIDHEIFDSRLSHYITEESKEVVEYLLSLKHMMMLQPYFFNDIILNVLSSCILGRGMGISHFELSCKVLQNWNMDLIAASPLLDLQLEVYTGADFKLCILDWIHEAYANDCYHTSTKDFINTLLRSMNRLIEESLPKSWQNCSIILGRIIHEYLCGDYL